MKALSLQSIGNLKLVDIAQPTPAEDQLLIRTAAATICTSDLNDIRENPFEIQLPVVMGHEAAGVVAGVGKSVRGFKVGDRVATHPVHPCKECEQCRAGRAHLCTNMGHFGLNMQGTFAEYYLVRADRARRVSDSVDVATATLAEPVCVCLQALAQAKAIAGSNLLIIGDGPFSLIMSRVATGMGLSQVVLAGRHDFRLSRAGSATTLNLRNAPDPLSLLSSISPAGGFDAVVATVGAIEAVQWGLELLHPKGRLVLFAAMPGQTPVDLFRVHVKELEIVGACNDEDRFDQAVRLLADQQLKLHELITHRLPWQQYEQAFSLAANRHDAALKVTLIWDKEAAR